MGQRGRRAPYPISLARFPRAEPPPPLPLRAAQSVQGAYVVLPPCWVGSIISPEGLLQMVRHGLLREQRLLYAWQVLCYARHSLQLTRLGSRV